MLIKRFEILISPEQFKQLEKLSKEKNVSMAFLIREALEEKYGKAQAKS